MKIIKTIVLLILESIFEYQKSYNLYFNIIYIENFMKK